MKLYHFKGEALFLKEVSLAEYIYCKNLNIGLYMGTLSFNTNNTMSFIPAITLLIHFQIVQ